MTTILQGTVDTLTAPLLHQPIAQARAGFGRLVVIDDGGGLADRFADPACDIVVDPACGNWDFFADHDGEADLALAARAIVAVPNMGAWFAHFMGVILEEILREVAEESSAQLFEVGCRIRAFADESGFERMRRLGFERGSYNDRAVQSACAGLRGLTYFTARDLETPAVSIREWLAHSPGGVVFINAGEPTRACRSVTAAIVCVLSKTGGGWMTSSEMARLMAGTAITPGELSIRAQGGC